MNEKEPNFESLRQLVALKRHEMPPPGYFNNFSRQVIARIRAAEAEAPAGLYEQLFGKTPWLFKLLQTLETKPAFAGGFATTLCALLVFGAVMAAQRPESVAQAILQPTPQEPAPLVASTGPATIVPPVNQFLIAENSTNPVISFSPAPFGQMPVSSQLIGFPISGN
jgi:hypothetical protein